jgi:FemAB-related protein (PEP-CTERM system-associated)
LEASPEANLNAIPRKARAVVRKALDEGVLRDEIDADIDRFYRVYAVSVRNLGSPVFSRRYVRELKREFGDDCEFLIVTGPGGKPVASVVSFYFRDEVLPYYGGGTAEARDSGAHAYLYFRLMCRAAERGARIFDFGRSKKDTGAYSFKKNFGFDPQPLAYEYKPRPGVRIPDATTLNPRYQRFIEMWRRLPLPVANGIGPYLVKRLG